MTDKSDKEVNVKMDKKIGFIGCGNMGGALAIAAANSVGASNIYVSDADNEKAKDLNLVRFDEMNIVGRQARNIATNRVVNLKESHKFAGKTVTILEIL